MKSLNHIRFRPNANNVMNTAPAKSHHFIELRTTNIPKTKRKHTNAPK